MIDYKSNNPEFTHFVACQIPYWGSFVLEEIIESDFKLSFNDACDRLSDACPRILNGFRPELQTWVTGQADCLERGLMVRISSSRDQKERHLESCFFMPAKKDGLVHPLERLDR